MLALPEAYVSLVRVHRSFSSARVLALKDLGILAIDKEKINIKKGDEVSLPVWLALELQKSGYAELRDTLLRDSDVFRYHHMERISRGGKPADIREDIYFLAELTIYRLSHGKNAETALRVEKLKRAIANMLDSRLSKVVNAALNLDLKQASDVSKALEEVLLFRILKRVLNSWRESVVRYVK
ncbi:MAG: hypothetical protein RMH84_02930 [Sulfolobales archaeon]|nr:hypothetical protein [Sulfolobales archaeon]MCX8208799.1 hypothetical protein [Sulfolobales archaeon]MDW8010530.1 hypothetical protein [Sulfolobales archaeon]